ncbi:protein disulfide isomerase family protein [Thiobacillus sp.]|uniref:thioredoxin family protein n=1 Tax=Thiobacillus sp. TaxID=924 RepID=UPI0025D2F629|nr:protein disulfide isomerase family protein [Thiobacillus sp.]
MAVGRQEKRDSIPLAPGLVQLSEGDFHRRIAATSGVAAVLFTAPRCGACQAWKRLLPDALAGIANHLYEVDIAEATGVARGYDIFHLPTIYLYRDGCFHAELQCEARRDAVRTTALALLAATPQEEP